MGRFYARANVANALMQRNNRPGTGSSDPVLPVGAPDLWRSVVANNGQKLHLFQMFCGIDKIARRDANREQTFV
jgi:hypothetical protein